MHKEYIQSASGEINAPFKRGGMLADFTPGWMCVGQEAACDIHGRDKLRRMGLFLAPVSN